MLKGKKELFFLLEILLIMPNVCVDQSLKKQTAKFKDVSTKYECDKRFWISSVTELERKIKVNYCIIFVTKSS